MRETPETLDDPLVRHRVFCPFIVAELRKQPDRIRLVFAILAVFEWQVEKHALTVRHGCIEALTDGNSRQPASYRVGGIGSRRVTEQVARELIQDDDGGEQRARGRGVAGIPACDLSVERQETLADLRIDVVVLGEPLGLVQFFEPEPQHSANPRGLSRVTGWVPAGDAHSGSPASRREAATLSASAWNLKGSFFI